MRNTDVGTAQDWDHARWRLWTKWVLACVVGWTIAGFGWLLTGRVAYGL